MSRLPRFTFPPALVTLPLRLALLALGLALPLLLVDLHGTVPLRTTVNEIVIRLAAGTEIALGRDELLAPQAESQHLRVRRDGDGRWWMSNVSQDRAVEVSRGGQDELLRTLPLQAGMRFWLAGQGFRVASALPRLAVQGDDGSGWWFDGAETGSMAGEVFAEPQAACKDEGWRATVRRVVRRTWNAVVPDALRKGAALEWGGHLACGGRVPFPALEPGEVRVAREARGYVLQASAAASRRICLAGTDGGCASGGYLDAQEVPLDGVTQVIVGRARFASQLANGEWRLGAQGRSLWLSAMAAGERVTSLRALGIDWVVRDEDPWRLPLPVGVAHDASALATGAGMLLLVAMVAWAARWLAGARASIATDWAALGLALALTWLVLGMGAFLFPVAVGAGWQGCIAGGAFLLLAVTPWPSFMAGVIFTGAAAMMAAGLAMLWALGWQATDSGGLRFFQKAAASAALAPAAWSAVGFGARLAGQRLMPSLQHVARRTGITNVSRQEAGILGLAMFALALLGLQAAVGAEEGVFGLQPVELGKLALVISAAHVLALRLEAPDGRGLLAGALLWLHTLIPLALVAGLVALSLVFLDDYSPLVLLVAWLVGLAVAWTVATRSVGGGLALLVLAGAAIWLYHWAQTDGLAWMANHGFYAERFAVWVDPSRHPHSGEQFLRASELLAQGGWTGNPIAQGWRIPAVQSDFAPAFFAGRFGARAVIGLLALQAIWIAALLTVGWRRLRASAQNYAHTWQNRLMFFATWGFGFLFAGHFALSWATNFGGLPVMGQPMPLLAAGNSLALLLLAPFIALLMLPPAEEV